LSDEEDGVEIVEILEDVDVNEKSSKAMSR
jgi:hypothetical protein